MRKEAEAIHRELQKVMGDTYKVTRDFPRLSDVLRRLGVSFYVDRTRLWYDGKAVSIWYPNILTSEWVKANLKFLKVTFPDKVVRGM